MLKIPIRNPYTIVTLGVAVAILSLGIAFRPKTKPTHQLSESDIARLQQSAQRNRLSDLSRFMRDVADEASSRLLYLKTVPHTAVFWEHDIGIAALDPSHPLDPVRMTVDLKDVELKARLTPGEAPFRAFVAPVELGSAAAPTRPTIAGGDWIIAVARQDEERVIFSYGIYQNTAPARCGAYDYNQVNSGVVLSDALLGGGLFDLRGTLIGFIALCNGNQIIIDATSVTSTLRLPVTLTDRLDRESGMGLTSRFDVPGGAPSVRVSMIRDGGPADRAGIQPGDTLTQIDGNPVHSVADIESILAPGPNHHEIIAQRSRKTLRLTLGEVAASAQATSQIGARGLTFSAGTVAGQVLVSSIVPGSPIAQAGLRVGDAVTQIGSIPAQTPQQAAHLLDIHRGPLLILAIERGTETLRLAVPYE